VICVEEPMAGSGHLGGDEPDEPRVLTIALTGDRAMVENIILEVRALAQKCGLQIPNVFVVSDPAVVPKKRSGR
jgi:hypothetical protein